MQNTANMRLSVLLFFALVLLGCDTAKKQDDFIDEASLPPSGYASTTTEGIIISDDKDDWRTAPIYAGKIRIDPIYPNPSAGQFVNLPVTVLEFSAVQGGLVLRADDGNGNLRLLDEILNAVQPGAYTFRFSPAIIGRTGLIRLLLFDRLGELVSYGDLQIG